MDENEGQAMPTFYGETLAEVCLKKDEWEIAESTRKIRAAGISELGEKLILRGTHPINILAWAAVIGGVVLLYILNH